MAVRKLPETFLEDKRIVRRKNLTIGGILIVCFIFALFVNTGYSSFYSPSEVFTCYSLGIQSGIAQLTGGADPVDPSTILASQPNYYKLTNQFWVMLMTVLCGGILAIAGTLYQNAFRNPIASPSMLGVSSAIQLGDVILVMMLGSAAASATGQRYLICYICVIVLMAVLFVLARFITPKGQPLNILNLLLIATILTQLIGVIVTYITEFQFDYILWQVYNSVSESISVNVDATNWITVIVTFAVALIPIVLLRFRLNALSFNDAEMKILGVSAQPLRIVALVCGTIMLMGAQVQMGTVAMLSLVVPHASRMIFGAEFRKQFWGNILLGAALLVACRGILGLLPLASTILPVSIVLNFIVLPFFVWMIATQQRGWED